jgi:hypothetical protein
LLRVPIRRSARAVLRVLATGAGVGSDDRPWGAIEVDGDDVIAGWQEGRRIATLRFHGKADPEPDRSTVLAWLGDLRATRSATG